MKTLLIIICILWIVAAHFRQRSIANAQQEHLGMLIRFATNLMEWKFEHPDEPNTHPEFQARLKEIIAQYRDFLAAHPNTNDDGLLRSLIQNVADESFA